MSSRVTLKITMTLDSDAIFGSGYSIPGGEDIAVVRDDQGYPFLPGSAIKGLIRESLENLLVWTGGSPADLEEIMGAEGWLGEADDRRLSITPLTLVNPPERPEDCFGFRTFTALESGIVKEKTLRSAACVLRGYAFEGSLTCSEKDLSLIQQALDGIRWVGALRSRGFGEVHFHAEKAESVRISSPLGNTRCIRYRLRTETPVAITNLKSSNGNSYETRGWIPGSAVRGMVLTELAARDPEWFQEHRIALLSSGTRFLDAVPRPVDMEVLPSLKGFYEDKEENNFCSVLVTPDIEGRKRAKLGTFCALDGDTIRFWSAKTGGVTRIERAVSSGVPDSPDGKEDQTRPFQIRHISAGQTLEGCILLDDPELAPRIGSVFSDVVWIGADRYEGYGRCAVTALEAAERPGWIRAYGYRSQDEISEDLYLLAVSPLTMLDENGEPCGLDLVPLAQLLGVEEIEIVDCATSIVEQGGYNRTWGSREPALPMYDRGSLFHLRCENGVPSLEKIQAIQDRGLGARASAGCGQVLFLRPDLYLGLSQKKKALEEPDGTGMTPSALVQLARYSWIMEHSRALYQGGLSHSQLGTIQSLCEAAISREEADTSKLQAFLNKNIRDRGVRHGSRFKQIDSLIRRVLEQPLYLTLRESRKDCPDCPDSMTARLELLCELFDYSRKGKEAR